MRLQPRTISAVLATLSILSACKGSGGSSGDPVQPRPDVPAVYQAALGCYAVGFKGSDKMIKAAGDRYTVEDTSAGSAARFRFHPADLGVYLLFDQDSRYLASDSVALMRQEELKADFKDDGTGRPLYDDSLISEGEWILLAGEEEGDFFLQHRASSLYLDKDGALGDLESIATLELLPQEGCAVFPDLTLNATGTVQKTTFEDGTLFGFVDAHEHLFTNYAFGGGVFHGGPYNRLGVKHALPDCTLGHGEEGRRDILGFGFGGRGSGMDVADMIPALMTGELPEDNHKTKGYPDFTDWPDAHRSPTHQMMYYKWVQRAYLGGLRLFVQHATTNQVLCELTTGIGAQTQRHDCNDMVNVDRIIEEDYALERYIDALHGGPGKGWFRLVFSPEEARQVIKDGKMAVVLGIETSDIFDCFLVPFGERKKCTEADVVANLDKYYEKGIRVLFPVHKFDNGFSAGDGDRTIIDLGNVMHTGHWANFIECPDDLLEFPGGFDNGGVMFGGLNKPRDVYDSPPPMDMSHFATDPINTLLTDHPDLVTAVLNGGRLEGQYCQNHGLTPLGEFLLLEMMKRGMVIEVDHFPRKSYKRAFELLIENDYPAVGSHGRDYNGLLYELGGISTTGFGRCRNPEEQATMDNSFRNRLDLMVEKGAYPGLGFGFDLNGFAGSPGPRFGENSGCGSPQTDEGITYPFTSYAGDITFEQPVVGNKTLDFNTMGMAHLGMVAELIQDVRLDGTTDEDLEPLFRSAEGYIRMWEKSEARGRAIRGE